MKTLYNLYCLTKLNWTEFLRSHGETVGSALSWLAPFGIALIFFLNWIIGSNISQEQISAQELAATKALFEAARDISMAFAVIGLVGNYMRRKGIILSGESGLNSEKNMGKLRGFISTIKHNQEIADYQQRQKVLFSENEHLRQQLKRITKEDS